MSQHTTQTIRNIALLGSASSGKTSLLEALLFRAGAIGHVGLVEKGDTVSDFTPEEKEHGHSLYNAIAHLDHHDTRINLIDTPGSPDFIGQAIAAIPAVETAVLVISAAQGLDAAAVRLLQFAADRKLCRMIIINKIDAPNIQLLELLKQIQENLGKRCLPLNLPANKGTAVVDCFFKPQGQSDFSSISEAHKAMVEQVVELDEALMTLYLDQGVITPQQLHQPFEEALRQGHLIPVCFTAARCHDDPEKSVGIDELLEIFVKLAPSPLEGNPRPFLRGSDQTTEIYARPDPSLHVLAHVFQIDIDPFVGKLATLRVHQGTLSPGSQLFVGDPQLGESKRPVKAGHLFERQGKDHKEVEQAIAGDIVALAKIEEIHRNAVLHDSHDEDLIHLKPQAFPTPMASVAISPQKRGDEQKIADALHKIAQEDPTLAISREDGTHEMVLHGQGELHLRVILEKMKSRYHITVDTHTPKIPYRETITTQAEGHHRHKKQTGGAGQFGEVFLRIEPLERGKGFEYVDDTFGGSIPRQFIPAIEKGVRQALLTGTLAGYPIQDVRVSVYDGKYHDVDSKEVAFVTAGKRAFIEAVKNARPVLLEPCVELEVTVPAELIGEVTGDLSGKRGRINGTQMYGQQAVIKAVVPLSEMSHYQNQLKSFTGGRGSYSLTMSHYEPVPPHVQQQISSQYQPGAQED